MTSYPGLPIGRLGLDEGLRIVEVDRAFEQLFGAGEELIGKLFDDLVSDRDPRGAVALAGALTQYRDGLIDLPLVIETAGSQRVVRVRMTRVDGRFWVYVEPGDLEGTLTYDLALTEQRWMGVLQQSDEGIVLLDPSGVIVLHNERFSELMKFRTARGVSPTETPLHGRQLTKLLSSTFQTVADWVGRLLDGVDSGVVRVEVGGRMLEFEGRTLRLPLRGGVETLVMVRDVSEQQQIAQRDALIAADLQQAAQFQAALLSRVRAAPGLELDITYRPLQLVGGDFYDVNVLEDGTTRMFIGDATGHGVTAALSTMLIMSEYDAIKTAIDAPTAILGMLNDRIAQLYRNLEVLFTAAVVDIAPDQKSMAYSCGGHPSPIACIGGEVRELPVGGAFIGIRPNQEYPQWSFALDRWSWLMMLTDGVSDARNAAGMLFGEERIGKVAVEAQTRGRAINASVLARLESHLDMRTANDDITMLTIQPVAAR